MPVQDDSAAWLQWAVSSVLGVFAVVYGTALLRLYGTVERVKDKQDQIAETARHLAEHGDREIWEAIDRLRTSMEEDSARLPLTGVRSPRGWSRAPSSASMSGGSWRR